MRLSEAWIDFASGWVSGAISLLVIQPIDTVLTRLQASPSAVVRDGVRSEVKSTVQTGITSHSSATATLPSSSILRSMISDFGISSLWRGSFAMIGAVPIQNALLMSGYGAGKRFSGTEADDHSSNVLFGVFVGGCTGELFIAVFLCCQQLEVKKYDISYILLNTYFLSTGGILQSFVMSPVELIKVSQQVINKSFHTATATVASSLHTPVAWKGLGATLLRDGIPHGVWFVSYEYCKSELTKIEYEGASKEIATPMLSGAFAATTAWMVGYPFDLIKTRIQAGTGKGVISTARDLVKEANGRVFYGLYRGFGLKLLRSIPASAIGFLTYETAAKALRS